MNFGDNEENSEREEDRSLFHGDREREDGVLANLQIAFENATTARQFEPEGPVEVRVLGAGLSAEEFAAAERERKARKHERSREVREEQAAKRARAIEEVKETRRMAYHQKRAKEAEKKARTAGGGGGCI